MDEKRNDKPGRGAKPNRREDRKRDFREMNLGFTAEQARASLCAHVQCVLRQLGEQDTRELIRLLSRITEIEASA